MRPPTARQLVGERHRTTWLFRDVGMRAPDVRLAGPAFSAARLKCPLFMATHMVPFPGGRNCALGDAPRAESPR